MAMVDERGKAKNNSLNNPQTMRYETFVFHSPRFDIFPLDFMLIAFLLSIQHSPQLKHES